MRYVIMADGKGSRWQNYEGHPKHLLQVEGETLLARIVRQVKQWDPDAEVYITSHDPRYDVEGATRYEPKHNKLEIDRFTKELIDKDTCFLYGDTYYSDLAMQCIVFTSTRHLLFFGNHQRIIAVKVGNAGLMHRHVGRVRSLYQKGKITECKGWQLYQSYVGLPFTEKKIGTRYIYLNDHSIDFNTPDDWQAFCSRQAGK